MRFSSDSQRKACFANMKFFNRFSKSKFSDDSELEELRKGSIGGPGTDSWNKFQYLMEKKISSYRDTEKDMKAVDFIEKQKEFVPTIDRIVPIGTELNLIGAVIAGTKPAALISDPITLKDPRFNELVDIAEKSGYSVIKRAESNYGNEMLSPYVIGKEPNISTINKHLDYVESGITSGVANSNQDDVALGRAFGYPQEAIKEYVRRKNDV